MARNAGKTRKVAGKKKYYLNKVGTNLVFNRTALLAKRDDMRPCSDAEAKRRIAAQDGDSRERCESYAAWKESGGHGKPPSLRQEDSEKAQQVADGLIPPEANAEADGGAGAPPVDPLADMGMAELVALAADKKVAVAEDSTEESLRAELGALVAADTDESQLPPATSE